MERFGGFILTIIGTVIAAVIVNALIPHPAQKVVIPAPEVVIVQPSYVPPRSAVDKVPEPENPARPRRWPGEGPASDTQKQVRVVPPSPIPFPPERRFGSFCCDSHGNRRCPNPQSRVGIPCFCDGQGQGNVCE